MEILPWTPLQILLHTTSFHALVCTHLFHEQHLPYLRIYLFLTPPIILCFPPPKNKILPSSLVPLQDPSLSLLPCPMEVGNLSHQSMAPSSFMNQWESRIIFLSNENEDENPVAQWTTRKVPFCNGNTSLQVMVKMVVHNNTSLMILIISN